MSLKYGKYAPAQPHLHPVDFKAWRVANGLSVQECADRLGISYKQARAFSTGTVSIPIAVAEKVLPPERWWWKNPELYQEWSRAQSIKALQFEADRVRSRAQTDPQAAEELAFIEQELLDV